MAEGLLRDMGPDKFDVFSAGSETHGLNPRGVQVMAEIGIDISGHQSELVEQYQGQTFDYVITVCEEAGNSRCPVFLGEAGKRLHWPFDDPAGAVGEEDEVRDVFRRVRDQIRSRLASYFKTPES